MGDGVVMGVLFDVIFVCWVVVKLNEEYCVVVVLVLVEG